MGANHSWIYWLAGLSVAGLLAYLLYALFHAEDMS